MPRQKPDPRLVGQVFQHALRASSTGTLIATRIDRARSDYRMLEFNGKGAYRVTQVLGTQWVETGTSVVATTIGQLILY